jgi:hypothetical protein
MLYEYATEIIGTDIQAIFAYISDGRDSRIMSLTWVQVP